MFRFYFFLLKLKLLVLQFVRSVRTGNREIYLASITNITYNFFALNHFNYARWTPVHIRDMLILPELQSIGIPKKADLRLTRREGCSQTLASTTGKNRTSKISNIMVDNYLLRIYQISCFYTLFQVQK